MTIKEIAKMAGVSVSTVSKIMNGKDGSISAETREHVLQIAKEYNYKPYASVQTPMTRTLCIGVVFRSTATIGRTVEGILSEANRRGYTILLRQSDDAPEEEYKNLSVFIGFHVDGILWEPVKGSHKKSEEQLAKSGIPYLRFHDGTPDTCGIDYRRMGYLATDTLLAKGHTEIACLLRAGSRTDPFYLGYQQCLFDHRIPLKDDLVFMDDTELPLSKIAGHLFSAMVLSHYTSAMRFCRLISELQYSIPYDLSVISLRDDSHPKTEYPQISTIAIPRYEFGLYLADAIVDRIEKDIQPEAFEAAYEVDHMLSVDIPFSARLKKIISFGSINIDNYLSFETLPHPGRTVSTSKSSVYPGGKCLNEAIGAARLGHAAAAIGCVGDDADADMVYESLAQYAVETVGISRNKGYRTGQAYIFVQQNGESMVSIMSGANQTVREEDVTRNERLFANGSYCLLQTEVPVEAVTKAALMAKKHGLVTVLKPSTCKVLPKVLLKHTDIIVPNHEELGEICPGGGSVEEKAALLMKSGVRTVLVTLGEQGCVMIDKKGKTAIPAVDVVSVDTTGAGDAFISAFVSYLLYGYDRVSAAKIATYAAGLSTTRHGVVPSLLDRHTLEAHIAQVEPELLR